jgi:hypothetical protein
MRVTTARSGKGGLKMVHSLALRESKGRRFAPSLEA